MYIQKLLGRWVALIRKNVGTDKKAYINTETLESCLKQAFKEIPQCDCEDCREEANSNNIIEPTREERIEEGIDRIDKINAIMRDTVETMRDPSISQEEKLERINKTREILLKEKARLLEKESKYKEPKQGNLFDLLKDAKVEAKMIGIKKEKGKAPKIIRVKDKEKIAELLTNLLNEKMKDINDDEDLEDFFG